MISTGVTIESVSRADGHSMESIASSDQFSMKRKVEREDAKQSSSVASERRQSWSTIRGERSSSVADLQVGMEDEMFGALVGELLVDVPWHVDTVSRRDRLDEVEAKHESGVLGPKVVHGGVVHGCLERSRRQH